MVPVKGKAPDAVQGRRSVQCCCLLLLVAVMLALPSQDRWSGNLTQVQTEKRKECLASQDLQAAEAALDEERTAYAAAGEAAAAAQQTTTQLRSNLATAQVCLAGLPAWLSDMSSCCTEVLARPPCPGLPLLDPTNTAGPIFSMRTTL